MKKFRTLRADEIDCRVATVTEKGVTLLLYKDARCDMNILDEAVGPENWQRHHSRDNANCTVAIWDDSKNQWIEKEDTGTESNTEKEKGLASDSFKRACFNWGIGRELYTAPFIWIPSGKCKIEKAEGSGRARFTCRDRFSVSQIGYDAENNINALVIKCKNKVVFTMGQLEPDENAEVSEAQGPILVETAHINTLYLELSRTGVGLKGILKNYGLNNIHEMNIDQFRDAMDVLKGKPDKPIDPATIPLENGADGLPWNNPERQ
ncbi:hypothetical protein [Enterocloster sp.]|uniref:hypothetical protein n=1 Tax=Enterocloster sp. TaxID=2719315 RepID=UPI003AB66791